MCSGFQTGDSAYTNVWKTMLGSSFKRMSLVLHSCHEFSERRSHWFSHPSSLSDSLHPPAHQSWCPLSESQTCIDANRTVRFICSAVRVKDFSSIVSSAWQTSKSYLLCHAYTWHASTTFHWEILRFIYQASKWFYHGGESSLPIVPCLLSE